MSQVKVTTPNAKAAGVWSYGVEGEEPIATITAEGAADNVSSAFTLPRGTIDPRLGSWYPPLDLPAAPLRGRLPKFPVTSVPVRRYCWGASNGWVQTGTVGTGGSTSMNDTTSGNFLDLISPSSLRITTGASANGLGAKKIGETALDMTGLMFRFVVLWHDVSHAKDLYVYFGDGDMANYYTAKIAVHSAVATTINDTYGNEFAVYHVGWADVTAGSGGGGRTYSAGTIGDKTGITAFRIFAFDDQTAATNTTINLVCMDIIPESTTPIVSIGFDDSYTRQKLALAKMAAYGFRGTLYTIWDLIDTSGRLTLAELRQARDLQGHEVQFHALTLNHHNSVVSPGRTAAQYHEDYRLGSALAAKYGFPADDFAYPQGYYGLSSDGVSVESIAQQYFTQLRTITPNPNFDHVPCANHRRRRSRSGISSAAGGYAVSTLTAAGGPFVKAGLHGLWIDLTFHDGFDATTPTTTNQVLGTDFDTLLADIAARGFEVKPAMDVYRQFNAT